MKSINLIHFLARDYHRETGMLFSVARPDPAVFSHTARTLGESLRVLPAPSRGGRPETGQRQNWFLEWVSQQNEFKTKNK